MDFSTHQAVGESEEKAGYGPSAGSFHRSTNAVFVPESSGVGNKFKS